MLEINSSALLWRRDETRRTSEIGSLNADDPGGQDGDPPDGPDTPICCWNICSGVYTPESKVRTRKKQGGSAA